MKPLIEEFVRTFPVCQKAKADRRGTQGTIKPLPLPIRKWQSISMDWVVGLPDLFRHGVLHNAVLTVTDRATRIVPLIPTSSHGQATDTAILLLLNVTRLHGLPRSIVSDRDTKMTSAFYAELCNQLEVRRHFIAAYHPQANCLAKRTNQTMKQLLRTAQLEVQSWFDVLPHV